MGEQEPKINVNVGGNEYELRRDNAELYTYIARYALFNHIFVEQQNSDNVRTGLFLPAQYVGSEVFNMLASTMLKYEYPARLNQLNVSDTDADIISKILAGKDVDNINDDFPTWLPEV